MQTNYKVWFTDPEDKKEWIFVNEELANKFLELKKKQHHIGTDTLIKWGQFGVVPVEVIENEEEFYKSVLR